jgi:glycosyltransferase involved in cell wall biosynthesis
VKIAYVNADPGVPVFGNKGSSLHVREIVTAFLKHGARIDLFTSPTEGRKPPGWEDVDIHELPPISKAGGSAREQAAYDANEVLFATLEKSNYDFVYERYSLWSFAGMEFARENQIPGVLEVNAPLIQEQSTYRELHNESLAHEVAGRAFSAATALVAVSEELAAYLGCSGVPQEKVQVIPNGINPHRFRGDVSPVMPGEPGQCTVGFVGSLRPWHGLNVLIEAFARVTARDSGYRLLVVGDGPERAHLESEIRGRKISDSTHLAGAVPAGDVPAYLASIDIAVAPYPPLPNFYFSPLKVYEYMAAGCAVIASRVGQLQTLIEHGQTGWHVPPGDACALAEAIVYLKERPDLRAKLGNAARKTVMKDYTWDAVAERIFRIARLNAVKVLHGAA